MRCRTSASDPVLQERGVNEPVPALTVVAMDIVQDIEQGFPASVFANVGS